MKDFKETLVRLLTAFEKAIQYLDVLMKSDAFERIKHQERFFLDITTLASMGLGNKINCMLDQEERLYDLPISELDAFMDRLERSVGFL